MSDEETAWESMTQIDEPPPRWIERDYAGAGGYLRYTLHPEGDTLLQHPYYRNQGMLKEWRERRDAFFGRIDPAAPILTESLKRAGMPPDVIGHDGYER